MDSCGRVAQVLWQPAILHSLYFGHDSEGNFFGCLAAQAQANRTVQAILQYVHGFGLRKTSFLQQAGGLGTGAEQADVGHVSRQQGL